MVLFQRLCSEEQGSTSIEYALVATLISVGIIASAIAFANSANNIWDYISVTILTALNG